MSQNIVSANDLSIIRFSLAHRRRKTKESIVFSKSDSMLYMVWSSLRWPTKQRSTTIGCTQRCENVRGKIGIDDGLRGCKASEQDVKHNKIATTQIPYLSDILLCTSTDIVQHLQGSPWAVYRVVTNFHSIKWSLKSSEARLKHYSASCKPRFEIHHRLFYAWNLEI